MVIWNWPALYIGIYRGPGTAVELTVVWPLTEVEVFPEVENVYLPVLGAVLPAVSVLGHNLIGLVVPDRDRHIWIVDRDKNCPPA